MGTRVSRPKSNFKAAPQGLHPAVCVDVWDIYTEKRREEWGGGLQDKTRITWQIDRTYKDDEGKDRTYQVTMIYTASLHEKANLRKHLESWRGRKFTEAELNDFELENLIGVNCQLQVIHNITAGGDTYANVQTIVPASKGAPPLEATLDFVRHKDRQSPADQADHDHGEPDENYTVEDDSVPF